MEGRISISDDGLLDACPVSRWAPSTLDQPCFQASVRNKKPAIISHGAESWFKVAESNGLVADIVSTVESCDVEMLTALDGRNFLRQCLCKSRVVGLKGGLLSILSGDRKHRDDEDQSLAQQPDDALPASALERRYIRIYIDSHRKVLEKIDLSSLVHLALDPRETDHKNTSEERRDLSDESTIVEPNDTIKPFKLKNIGLWTSSEGCVTPLHFDLCHGFLAQIVGKKTFLLASSSESALLRYWRNGNSASNQNGTTSPVDLGLWLDGDVKERRKYPLIDEVAWFIASLGPGDILYTPPGWWHYVISDTSSVSVLIPFDPLPHRETLPTNVLTA